MFNKFYVSSLQIKYGISEQESKRLLDKYGYSGAELYLEGRALKESAIAESEPSIAKSEPLSYVQTLNGEVIRVVEDNGSYGQYLSQLNPRIQIIGINNLNSISNNYRLPSGIYPGDILFKHPFLPDAYVSASLSEQEFFKQKLKCFASICQELGAKSVSGHAEWIDSKEMECGFGGDITIKVVSLNASYVSSEKSRIEKSYYLRQNYAGGTADVAKAEQLARRYGLWNDFDVRDLIESRSRNNSILSQDVRIALSTELNKTKEIAFSLNAVKIFKLSGSIKDDMSHLNNVSITLQVGF